MLPHLPAQLVGLVCISHLLPDSTCLPPLLLLHMAWPLRVATGLRLRASQQVLEMPVGVNREPGVIALLDDGDQGLRAKVCHERLELPVAAVEGVWDFLEQGQSGFNLGCRYLCGPTAVQGTANCM